jgi:adenine-specific DNA-methyltransferase
VAREKKTAGAPKKIEALKHSEAKRKNIPTAELQSAAQRAEEIAPFEPVRYQRRSPLPKGSARQRGTDLDPQLVWKGARIRLTADQLKEAQARGFIDIDEAQVVWRGKDEQDWSDLVVHAPPLYIQEKIHPKAIIEDLVRRTKEGRAPEAGTMDLFHDFNGVDPEAKTEFYAHDQNWSNRMILGDSLQVMASLAEREGLRGQVQCIYFDPPYGIKFNSNWQVSTRSRDVKDGKQEEISREPEQVKAFRDTWRDGIHSYLTYLRDRLTAMRDLLTESGSIFVQIGDENVHRVRALLDEVFGEASFVSQITMKTTGGLGSSGLKGVADFILWYAKSPENMKFRKFLQLKEQGVGSSTGERYDAAFEVDTGIYRPLTREERQDPESIAPNIRTFQYDNLVSSGFTPTCIYDVELQGQTFSPGGGRSWKTNQTGMARLIAAGRVGCTGKSIRYRRFLLDYPAFEGNNIWLDNAIRTDKEYIVETSTTAIQRCILMTSDPGDLVFDPTCGSGTTAYVAEQWGRRWITADTSRVALAIARSRVMSARYPYYILADSRDGRLKEAELSGGVPKLDSTFNDVRHGFVYARVPHVTLRSIANNAAIDVIVEEFAESVATNLQELNEELGKDWNVWEVPISEDPRWSAEARRTFSQLRKLFVGRQKKIDKVIAQTDDIELLYDRPYDDPTKIRVSGPFTVESLSPHRVVPADEYELVEKLNAVDGKLNRKPVKHTDFTQMIMEHLKSSGVQQGRKEDRITFTTITGWPGNFIAAEGRFMEGEVEKRAGIFIGPEFGTVSRADLTAAAREALDARFDALIGCGFNFEAHTSELNKLGPLPILKAKMNPDLHMSEELKNTGAGNLFIVFGEPDIKWAFDKNGKISVEVVGIDVFDPKTGEVRASGKDDIAAWFIDTDYNEESFFVRHAYFLGANDPYKALKTSLKAEIDPEAWETLYRDVSRPFERPSTGRFAVKVINHFGDEVMKVFAV